MRHLIQPGRLLLIPALLMLLSGCSVLRGQLETPQVSLSNVSLVNAGLIEQTFRLTLRVRNPNDVPIPVKGLDYSVRLSGNDFARGLTPRDFTLPAGGEELVDVDVTTNLLDVGRQLLSIIESQQSNVDYEVTGKLRVDLPFVNSLPFSRSGTVNLNYN